MNFLTPLLTGGAKRFHHLPWDINSANSSTCELIHISLFWSLLPFSWTFIWCLCVHAKMCQGVIVGGDKSVNGRACVAT